MRRAFVFQIWMLITAFGAIYADAEPRTRPAAITGIVKDLAGEPVAGAEVVLAEMNYSAGNMIVRRTITTGADGRFDFDWLEHPEDSLLAIAVDKPGLAWKLMDVWSTTPRPITVELRPAATAASRVVDGAGKPIEGAILYPSYGIRDTRQRAYDLARFQPGAKKFSATTDAQGRFRFEQLPAGASIGFLVDHPKYALLNLRPHQPGFEPGRVDLRIEMFPPASIEGRVVDESGHPVEGVPVGPGNETFNNNVTTGSKTDSAGRFKFERLTPGEYTIASGNVNAGRFKGKGLMIGRSRIKLAAGQQLKGIELKWVSGVPLRGRVIDSITSKPVPRAWISVEGGERGQDAPNPFWSAVSRADEHGRFENMVIPGRVSAWAQASKYTSDPEEPRAETTVKAGEIKEVVVRLRPILPIHVSGVVVDADGKPVSGAIVQASPENLPASTQTDVNGRFSIKIERAKSYGGTEPPKLTAMVPGKELIGASIVPDKPGSEQNVTIKVAAPGRIAGTVTDADGKPIAGARVALLERVDGDSFNLRGKGPGVAGDQHGRFQIGGVIAGEPYGIRCSAAGHGSSFRFNIKAESGEVADQGVIKLPKADCFIALTVKDEKGEAAPDVAIYYEDPYQSDCSRQMTDKNGKLKIGPLAAGHLYFTGSKGRSFFGAQVELKSGQTLTHEAKLMPPGR